MLATLCVLYDTARIAPRFATRVCWDMSTICTRRGFPSVEYHNDVNSIAARYKFQRVRRGGDNLADLR